MKALEGGDREVERGCCQGGAGLCAAQTRCGGSSSAAET